MDRESATRRPFAPLAVIGFVLAIAAVATCLAAGLGTRAGLWDYRTGFRILPWGAWAGLAAAVLSLGGGLIARPGSARRGLVLAIAGLIVGAASFGVPYMMRSAAQAAPRVWDITTDMEDPPRFIATVPLRGDAPNKPEYRGGTFKEIQAKAYPDIQPLKTGKVPQVAYATALEVAQSSGWEMVAAVPAERRIEAVATTFWFGFKDDVVIRVRPDGQGSRIDIRSYSRLGRNDAGTNAKRVRTYLSRLRDALGNM